MNYKMVFSILGKVFLLEALLLIFPMAVGFIYNENTFNAYLYPIIGLLIVGAPLSFLNSKDKNMYAKEGFVVVSLAWILMSVIGAIPFVLTGTLNFVDALFETVSGFTTTGSTVINDLDVVNKSILFWRSLTHWIGGMGVLVFILALIPADSAGTMHIFRAESPGISASKFVSKMRFTARILYSIYLVLTILEVCFLALGKMPLYDSVLYAFSTAGTGGFSISNAGISAYNSGYIETVVAVFMMLFGINFNVYYLIIIGQFAKAFKSEELKVYLLIVATATLIIAINVLSITGQFVDAIRISFFQVASISSSTGLATADFVEWPALSKSILMFLTIVGACGGSTGGGLKVARLIVLSKSGSNDLRKIVNGRLVTSVNFEGQSVVKEVERGVRLHLVLWVGIVLISTFILSFDTFAGNDVFTNFSASLACIGNVGPGLTSLIGPLGNYAGYNGFSKIVMSFVMLAGRLELLPMLVLFRPRTWIRGR